MKINFLSATGAITSGPFAFFRNLPYKLAFREEGPNYVLLDRLKKSKGKVLGVAVMDFPGNELIERIIESNFV